VCRLESPARRTTDPVSQECLSDTEIDKISWNITNANRGPLVDGFPQNIVLLCFLRKVVLEIVILGLSELIKLGIGWRVFFYFYEFYILFLVTMNFFSNSSL
jgi:hypothetical protein